MKLPNIQTPIFLLMLGFCVNLIIAPQARTAKKFLPLCKIAAAWIFQELVET